MVNNADDDMLRALVRHSEKEDITDQQLNSLAFVCMAYQPEDVTISGIPDLRWFLCKHMAESKKLPPTEGVVKEHILSSLVHGRLLGQASHSSSIVSFHIP